MDPTPRNVVVVDDDPSLRRSLERLVSAAGYRVDTFGSATEFRDHWVPRGPTCVILDLHMPGLDGFELHHRLMEADAPVATIFLTGYGSVPTSVEAIKAGAFDFLEKPVDAKTLLRAIEGALDDLAEEGREARRLRELRRRLRALTPRERQVMELVVAGQLNKQIARDLGISIKTVKVHRGRVMRKMGARRLPHLMTAASALGLVPVPSPESGATDRREDPESRAPTDADWLTSEQGR